MQRVGLTARWRINESAARSLLRREISLREHVLHKLYRARHMSTLLHVFTRLEHAHTCRGSRRWWCRHLSFQCPAEARILKTCLNGLSNKVCERGAPEGLDSAPVVLVLVVDFLVVFAVQRDLRKQREHANEQSYAHQNHL